MSTTPKTKKASKKPAPRQGDDTVTIMQVVYFFLVAFAGAVLLFVFRLPPIFPAILIGVALGFVTFYSLGGIESSTKFSLGPVNVSGSLAAIAVATFGINYLLSNQIIDPDNAFPEAQWLAVASDLTPVDSVQIGSWGFMASPRVSLNGSTPLDVNKSGSDFKVYSVKRPDLVLGTVNRDTLDKLVRITFPSQKEETFKTDLLKENSRSRNPRDFGLDFPFYVQTGRFQVTSGYFLKDIDTHETLFEGSLRRNQAQVVEIRGRIYFVTTAQVNHQPRRGDPYVQLIVGELKPQKVY